MKDDLISRQAAIDAINTMFAPTPTQMDMKEDCLEIIENLPSALPKSHGRLIDADALRKSFQESIDECHKWAENVDTGEMYARVSQALGTFVECSLRTKNAPTIIEAEKEETT